MTVGCVGSPRALAVSEVEFNPDLFLELVKAYISSISECTDGNLLVEKDDFSGWFHATNSFFAPGRGIWFIEYQHKVLLLLLVLLSRVLQ